MNQRNLTVLLLLLLSLLVQMLGWWLKNRQLWDGANALIVGSAPLALLFAVVLLRRLGRHRRPLPMD